jgi:hypothetical protein
LAGVTIVFSGGEPFVTVKGDFWLECDKGLAFDFATGEVVVEIESLNIEIGTPLRESARPRYGQG